MKRFFQSGYYKLTRHVFKGVLLRGLTLGAGLFALTLILLPGSVNADNLTQPYEALIRASGLYTVFFGALAVSVLLMVLQIHFDIYKSHGYSVVMTLPMPRRHVFFAYCTAGIVSILILWAVQTLALILVYGPVTAACERAAADYERINDTVLPFVTARTNGLFLAVTRSSLFHVLLPMSLPEAVNTLLLILTAGVLPAYVMLGEKKRIVVVPALIALSLLIWVVSLRTDLAGSIDLAEFVWGTALMGLMLVYMMTVSVCRMNKDANLV